MNNILKIRAHHLLCMQGFQGYGYSEDFVDNMQQVIKHINSSPEQKIEIISDCDIICSKCPYNKKEVCTKNSDSAAKLKDMDMNVLKKLELKKSEKIKSKDILSLIKTKLKKSDIENICKDCSWKDKCLLVSSPRWNNISSSGRRK